MARRHLSSLEGQRIAAQVKLDASWTTMNQFIDIREKEIQNEPNPPHSFWAIMASILLTDAGINALSAYIATNLLKIQISPEQMVQNHLAAVTMAETGILLTSTFIGTIIGGVTYDYILSPIYERKHQRWSIHLQKIDSLIANRSTSLIKNETASEELRVAHFAAGKERAKHRSRISSQRPPRNYRDRAD